MSKDIRWKQRFQNFSKALQLLREPFANDSRSLSALEKHGVIRRLRIAFDLGWKMLRDYLLFTGAELSEITPRSVINEGFSQAIIADLDAWLDMMRYRATLANICDESALDKTVHLVGAKFLPALSEIETTLITAYE